MELGIPDAMNMKQADLIEAIKQKVSPNAALTLSVPAADSKKWLSPPVIMSCLALIVSAVACVGSWIGSIAAVDRLHGDNRNLMHQIEEDERRQWSAVRMYEILFRECSSAEKWTGLTFEELKSKYSEEVVAEQYVKLGKADLQPDEIRRVLLDAMRHSLIYRTMDGRYIPHRVAAQAWDCARRPSSEETERAILRVLESESGKLTVDKLGVRVRQNSKITSEDYYIALNCMKSRRLVQVDADNVVRSALEASDFVPPDAMPIPKTMPKPKDETEKGK